MIFWCQNGYLLCLFALPNYHGYRRTLRHIRKSSNSNYKRCNCDLDHDHDHDYENCTYVLYQQLQGVPKRLCLVCMVALEELQQCIVSILHKSCFSLELETLFESI